MQFSLALFMSLGLLVPALAAPKDIATETTISTTAVTEKHTQAALPFIEQTATLTNGEDQYTIFNEVKVPPLRDLNGSIVDEDLKDGYWFVKHYSPYCHHCKAVAPVWQTLYEFYYTSNPVQVSSASKDEASLNDFRHYYNFNFGSLDCVAFGSACDAHKVEKYPTFILYKNGQEIERFVGTRDLKGLSGFVEKVLEQARPGSRTKGGPKLPEVGANHVEGYVPPSSARLGKEKAANGKTQINSSASLAPQPSKASKPTVVPNSAGTMVSLTAESFQHLVTMSQEPWFIKFYAPWCPHCQAMASNWVQLGKEMKNKLNIGEVNCEAESRLCKDIRVHGYPTILFFRGGERVEYDGLRGLGDFVSYANKAIAIGSGVKDVTAAEFKEFEETEEVIFLYFYDHATTSEDFAALQRLTLSLVGHARLVKTQDQELVDRYKITTWPRLLVSREGRPTYYTGLAPSDMRDFRKVLNWMQSVWLPIVPELTASNSREIMEGKMVVLAVLSRERLDEFMISKKEVKSAALEWMDKQTQLFQIERQDLRQAKQLRIEEAEDRNDQRALRAAKSIRIDMDQLHRKEVAFAWVDGIFWDRWLRTTYGVDVKAGERVIINDEDTGRYWDNTITGNPIIPSRTSILETISKVTTNPPKIKPKLTISRLAKFFLDVKVLAASHKYITLGLLIGLGFSLFNYGKRKVRSRGNFFKLDEKSMRGLPTPNGAKRAD